jgi:hypothetical protein
MSPVCAFTFMESCDEPGIVRINFTLKAARPAPVCTALAPSIRAKCLYTTYGLVSSSTDAMGGTSLFTSGFFRMPATKTFQRFVIDLCDKVIEALVGTVQRGV